MADPARGSCRFASHRERSSTPCSGFRRARSPLLPPTSFPLSRRDILRTPTFRNSECKSRSRQVLLKADTRLSTTPCPPLFAIWCYLTTSTCIGCVLRAYVFYFYSSSCPDFTSSSSASEVDIRAPDGG